MIDIRTNRCQTSSVVTNLRQDGISIPLKLRALEPLVSTWSCSISGLQAGSSWSCLAGRTWRGKSHQSFRVFL